MQKIPLDTHSTSNLFFELHKSTTNPILGLVQISHGMAEHKRRYQEFIDFLNINGFHVAIHDHRGHGDRILDNEIGFFDNDDGWNLVVDDLLAIHSETNNLFPELPKILLGHSMGSWIGLSALQQNNNFSAALLSGSSYPNHSDTILQKLFLDCPCNGLYIISILIFASNFRYNNGQKTIRFNIFRDSIIFIIRFWCSAF